MKDRLCAAASVAITIILIPIAVIYIMVWGVLTFGSMIVSKLFKRRC